uniref:SCP domain-containing protein n=1 Tax=Globodera rostochiensis TaxID=31243 RepID=A0A914HLJ8_GLORO
MASQSLVLVQLLCLVMLARHSACWSLFGHHKCYHSLRYHEADIATRAVSNIFRHINAFVDYLLKEWKDVGKLTYYNVKTFVELTECDNDVSCETFRKWGRYFCAQCMRTGKGAGFRRPKMHPPQRIDGACNEKEINLKRPADATPIENHCIHAFRHNQSYTPDPALKKMMNEWQISNFTDKDNIECLMGNVGCQTYRCKNEFGNDIFVVNGCATKDEHFKCVYDKLDPFCLPEDKRYEHCEYCLGSSCNSNKTELETLYLPKTVGTKSTTRSTKGTTTTEELDNETDESESTKRSKKLAPSTKRPRRPRASKRPKTPETTATNAAAAPYPSAMPAVLLPFCLPLFFRHLTVNVFDG